MEVYPYRSGNLRDLVGQHVAPVNIVPKTRLSLESVEFHYICLRFLGLLPMDKARDTVM